MTAAAGPGTKSAGRVRWAICVLLFSAVVLSYVDRLVLPVLKPRLQADYDSSEQGYSYVNVTFQATNGIDFFNPGYAPVSNFGLSESPE